MLICCECDENYLALMYTWGTNLRLIHIIGNVCLIGCLRNVSAPSRHKFDVIKMALLPLELEVGVDGNIESI